MVSRAANAFHACPSMPMTVLTQKFSLLVFEFVLKILIFISCLFKRSLFTFIFPQKIVLSREIFQVLPQLASLDEITYTACTTLKDPKKTALTIQQIQAKNKGDIPKPTLKEEPQNEKGRKDMDDKQETQESVGKKENETVQENKVDSPREDDGGLKENSTERTRETNESQVQNQAESEKGSSAGESSNLESSEKDIDEKEIKKEGEEHTEKGMVEEAEKCPKDEQEASSLQSIPKGVGVKGET